MFPTSQGSFRLFRFAGIDVFLHWSWLIIAYLQIIERQRAYSSLGWNVAEYLSLFAIVLMHEFGHSLATRQVGGHSDQIVLWPFGGVAYVNAPPRPGAQLWSIAAGPLVNVVILIVLEVANFFGVFGAVLAANRDLGLLLHNIWWINLGLLIFNLLPIFPLDGGQILRSLLWFPLGPWRSLMIAAIIGLVGTAIGLLILLMEQGFSQQTIWLGLLALLVFSSCRNALMAANNMKLAEKQIRGEL